MEGGKKTIVDMADKMSAVAFGDTIEQNRDPKKPGANVSPTGPGQIATDSVYDEAHTGDTDVDMVMDMDSEEGKDGDAVSTPTSNKQKAIWDVLEPSEANLNKLDGWSPKASLNGAKDKEGGSDIDTSSVTALENWLKENLPEDYVSPETGSEDKEKSDRRKSRVRWADVESQLQGLGVTLQPVPEPSTTSGSEA